MGFALLKDKSMDRIPWDFLIIFGFYRPLFLVDFGHFLPTPKMSQNGSFTWGW